MIFKCQEVNRHRLGLNAEEIDEKHLERDDFEKKVIAFEDYEAPEP